MNIFIRSKYLICTGAWKLLMKVSREKKNNMIGLKGIKRFGFN